MKSLVHEWGGRCAAGLRLHRLWRGAGPYLGLILMFHRVARRGELARHPFTQDLWVTEEKLDAAIQFFQRRDYEIASPDRMLEVLQAGTARRPVVVFTFDDGFADNGELAWPIFQKHQAPATFYITSSLPDGGFSAWPYALEEMALRGGSFDYEFEGAAHRLPLGTMKQKRAAWAQVRDLLLALPPGRFEPFARAFFQKAGFDIQDYTRRAALSWDQWRALAKDPLATLGGHTASHFMLSRLEPERAFWEIEKGQARLEAELGRPARHFAYPFGCKPPGKITDRFMEERFGLSSCVATCPGYLLPDHAGHRASLPRLNVSERTSLPQLEIAFKRMMDRAAGRACHFVTG